MDFEIFRKIQEAINKSVKEYSSQYTAFGIFGLFNYPIYFFIWLYLAPQTYENLFMRLIATLLCLLLVLHKRWPLKYQKLLPVYWYFTVFFCLPFFFTFMLIKNHGTSMWVANTILIIFFLMFLVDWISCLIMLLLGGALGVTLAYITSDKMWLINSFDYVGFFITYVVSVVIGAIFSHNKQMIERHKLYIVESMGASIAHELRTPLRIVSSSANGIQKYLPQMLETYQIAKKANLKIPHISNEHYEALTTSLKNINSEIESAFNFINMLLVNAGQAEIMKGEDICSMVDCINKALLRYPFDLGEYELIKWEQKNDFLFIGDELLIIHVIFNLLKNSIYYIRSAGKGYVSIHLETTKDKNILHFKDTGKGISSKIIPYIFDRFFSKTPHGTGIGLTYCKLVMHNFGGDIQCYSEEGKYTEFILVFPKIP